MILGVVLAGGQATRFGSDKALAELGGQTLLARAFDTLTGFCELVVIAGRERGPGHCIPDWPHPGMGPLAGIAAALHLARDEGYDSVLTCGVDSVLLPDNLLELLSPGPRYLADQPVVGHWPAGTVDAIETILLGEGKHSMLAFAQDVEAVGVGELGLIAVGRAHDDGQPRAPGDFHAGHGRVPGALADSPGEGAVPPQCFLNGPRHQAAVGAQGRKLLRVPQQCRQEHRRTPQGRVACRVDELAQERLDDVVRQRPVSRGGPGRRRRVRPAARPGR